MPVMPAAGVAVEHGRVLGLGDRGGRRRRAGQVGVVRAAVDGVELAAGAP